VCAAAFEPIDQATELAAMSAKIEAEMHNALAEKVTKLETTVTELLTQLEDIAKALETEEHADDAKAGKVLNTWLKKQAAYWTGKVGSK
jgi:TRAP-type mannitol/chloroaromatic compound transport system substrate-binding protein